MDKQQRNVGIRNSFSRLGGIPLAGNAVDEDRETQEFKQLLKNFRKKGLRFFPC